MLDDNKLPVVHVAQNSKQILTSLCSQLCAFLTRLITPFDQLLLVAYSGAWSTNQLTAECTSTNTI